MTPPPYACSSIPRPPPKVFSLPLSGHTVGTRAVRSACARPKYCTSIYIYAYRPICMFSLVTFYVCRLPDAKDPRHVRTYASTRVCMPVYESAQRVLVLRFVFLLSVCTDLSSTYVGWGALSCNACSHRQLDTAPTLDFAETNVVEKAN